MNSLGFFGILAGLLQLTIPPYAFRLVRRFGAEKVGWFIVSAFACLGLLHLLDPLRALNGLSGSTATLDAIYAISSVLLLIGMAHVEALVSARIQAAGNEKKLHGELEMRTKEKISALEERNEELSGEIASCLQRLKALEESEFQYRFLFTQNPQPMWILDLRTSRFLAVNNTALAQFGFTEPEFMAAGAAGLISAEAKEAFLHNINSPCSGVESRGCWPLRRKDGSLLEVGITAVDLKYGDYPARLLLATDISSRRRDEQQLLEEQRLKLVGRIAGGVAHHFNNILTIISGHTELLLQASSGNEMTGQLNNISAAVHRGACLTRALHAAGSQQALEVTPLNLNDALKRSNPMLQRLLGDSILLQNRFANDLPPVMADARAVEHIVVGLILNARDAISCSGAVTLSTKAIRITESEARCRNDAKAGEFVCVKISDTGCGMTPETRTRLFEPFYTTKDVGKATGLGLASAYGLAKQQSGWIECVSDVQKGTEVTLFLPRARGVAVTTVVAAIKTHSETVLLIEPDDRARALARYILNRQGYVVIESDSGELALSLWESEGARVDLLVTELALPGKFSGLQLARRLQSAKPGLKVMYASGCPEQTSELEKEIVVIKPYTAESLSKSVEQRLARG